MQIPKDLKAHPENILILNIPANREGEVYQGYILTASLELNKYRAIYPNPLPVKTSEFPFETNPETCIENCIVGDRIQYNKEMQAMHSAIPYQTYMLYATMGVYLPHRNVIVSAFGSLNLRDIYFKLKSHGLTQDDISGLTWQGLYSIAEDWVKLHQTAQTAAQSTNAAQTDREHSPSDKEPQMARKHNKPTKAESIRRNKKVGDCINEYTKYHSKITVAKISEITELPPKKIYNIPAYRAAERNGFICKATDKNTIAGQVKPYEDVNLHTGQGQSHLRELTTDIDYDALVMLEDNADFNGYE